MKIVKILLITAILFLTGCFPAGPLRTEKAKLGKPTTTYKDLISLPAAKEKIYCAVYKFRDQTGQYKSAENGASWSTAVTQGATSILTKALEESGWFIPIEREGLSNLLNERKIIRSSRENFQAESGGNAGDLPPLLYAGVLLEGGIISYETNVHTGGIGAKYFGAGGSGLYRQDQVSIYLRAISTQTGRVLKTVYTTKTILSQAVDAGLFRFVELKKLLEVEMGYSYNEPPQLAVTAAIEKAVLGLVVEGILDGLWIPADEKDLRAPVIDSYLKEKEEVQQEERFVLDMNEKRSWGLGFSFGGNFLNIDYGSVLTTPSFEIKTEHFISNDFSLSGAAGGGTIEAEKFFSSDIYYLSLAGNYYFVPESRLSPYLTFGGSYNLRSENKSRYAKNSEKVNLFSMNSGLGLRYLLGSKAGINILFSNNFFFNDELDDIKNGKWNDYYWTLKTGFTYYF